MPDPAPTSAWAPLRLPVFRALWIASVASNIGTWMQSVGAGWLMTSLAPQPFMVSLVQAATALPMFLFALPAGALADIVDRRRYLIVSQVWMLTAAAGLAGLALAGSVGAWTLLAFTAALGLGAAFMAPAWQALTPEVVPRDQLRSAIALNSVGVNVSRAVGPALAGVVVAALGTGAVFLLNAVSFLGIIVVLVRWRREERVSNLPGERFFGALRTGLGYAAGSPELRRVLARAAAFFLCASSLWGLLPLIARQRLHGGPQSYGLLLGSMGAGAVAGALCLPWLRRRLSADALVSAATVLYAATLAALALLQTVPPALAVMAATGAAWVFILASLNTAAHGAVPSWVRARALSVYLATFFGSMAGGSALWGLIAGRFGIPTALGASAAGLLAGAGLTLRVRIESLEGLNLAPSMQFPAPRTADDVEPQLGPVLITVEYRVDPARAAEFTAAARELRRLRRRDGALTWALYRDSARPDRYTEVFVSSSWAEHLRQHERTTIEDEAVIARVRAFQVDGERPRVEHLIDAYSFPTAAG